MTRALMARPPKGLARMDLNAEQVKLIDAQISLVVDYQLGKLTAYTPLRDQFKELARNCYLQGVLDGNQARMVEA